MTDQATPIRKSLLPCTPPPEWEFSTVLGAPHGCALLPSDQGPVVVRRRVSYGDWEPVRPDRWAEEPPSDAALAEPASCTTPCIACMTDESHNPAPPPAPNPAAPAAADLQPAFTVTAQTISVLVSGQPDIENKFGPGRIRPDGVRLSYRGQHIDARVDGRWVRECGELTTERLDQHYTVRDATDIAAWPDWLCALATLIRPPAAAPSAAADQIERRERYAIAIRDQIKARTFPPGTGSAALFGASEFDIADAAIAVADAELLAAATVPASAPADRAAVLREAAVIADQLPTPDCAEMSSLTNAWDCGTYAVATELRRRADEAQQP